MRKPMIGVLPLYDGDKDSYWMLPGYMKGVEEAGGIPVMLPLTTDIPDIEVLAESFDGFLFTGGHDVDPILYGEKKDDRCGEICTERDELERVLFELAVKLDKPAFGICRGLQLFNVLLGGTLYQDIPSQRPEESEISHKQKPPYAKPAHPVRVLKESGLFRLLGKETLQVNSYHHQGIKGLAPSLEAAAVSESGLIEAVIMPDKRFVWAVQWHPEFSLSEDPDSKVLFRSFVEACRAGVLK